LNDHGGSLIPETDYYDNPTYEIPVIVTGTNEDNLNQNISTLQALVEKQDVELEYKNANSTNSNYNTILFATCTDPYESPDWEAMLKIRAVEIIIYATCKPGWRGAQQTISASYSLSPAVILPGTILGDIETDAYVEFRGVGSKEFGDNLLLSARRKDRIDETVFNPIKDFSGTASATSTYNGQFNQTSGVNNTDWFNLTGESTNINGVAEQSASIGVRVGDGGLIETTADGWVTVTPIAHGLTTQPLNVVVWAGGTTYYVGGNAGVLLKSTDSGATWSALTSGTSRNITHLAFANTSVGWFATDSGGAGSPGILSGTTNGSSWSAQDAWALSHYRGLACSGATQATAVMQYDNTSTILTRKTTNGSTWSTLTSPTGIMPRALSMISSSAIWMAGDGGELRYYNGASWTTQTSGVSSSIRDIKMQSASVGWFCGVNGAIGKTADGSTWTLQSSNISANLNSIAVVDASNVNIAGDGYTMLDTSDGGTTWTQLIAAWALSSADDYKGTAHVLARVRTADTASSSVQLRASCGWAGGSVLSNDAVYLANSAAWQWVDCGAIQIPATALSPEISATPIIKLEAKGASTSVYTFDIDVSCLFYVDGEKVYIKSAASASDYITADRENEAVNKGRTIINYLGGDGIKLRPGTLNNILALETEPWVATADGIDAFDVVLKYYPLYLSPVA